MRVYDDGQAVFYAGDVLDVLRDLPEKSAQTCVTSPPYWGLRDYGCPGQIGLEATPDEYVTRLVEVFREVRRVLADDGTLWLNLGDSFASQPSWGRGGGHNLQGGVPHAAGVVRDLSGLKPKDLVGVPWMVAFALRADGWWLRSDIIWHKPNPMPESVTDRPTKSHEYLFLLSKQERYYYDNAAIREAAEWARWGDQTTPKYNGSGTATGWIQPKTKTEIHKRATDKQRGHSRRHAGFNDRWDNMSREEQSAMGRNKRSVWTVATEPYPEAHFATYPPALITPCILAGSREGDTVLDPFIGSGTTAQTAKALGRKAIGIDLNPEYLQLAVKRCMQMGMEFASSAASSGRAL